MAVTMVGIILTMAVGMTVATMQIVVDGMMDLAMVGVGVEDTSQT